MIRQGSMAAVALGLLLCLGCAGRQTVGRGETATTIGPTAVVPALGVGDSGGGLAARDGRPGVAGEADSGSLFSATARAGDAETVGPHAGTPPSPDAPAMSGTSAPLAAATAAATAATSGSLATDGVLQDVFFDFDDATIRDDQRTALRDAAGWLKANPDVTVVIEGYCDERGTSEYNIGLGERRARAVKDELVLRGVAPARIAMVSYGAERPFVLGHDESVWRWNRRAHLVLRRG